MSVKTKVTVPAGSESPNIRVGISAAIRQPEIQLDVVRTSKHNHRPSRCLRDGRCIDSCIDNWPVRNSSKVTLADVILEHSENPSRLRIGELSVLDRLVIAGRQHR